MSKGTIFLADDEEILTASLQKVLSNEGYSIKVCNKGDQFLFHGQSDESRYDHAGYLLR